MGASAARPSYGAVAGDQPLARAWRRPISDLTERRRIVSPSGAWALDPLRRALTGPDGVSWITPLPAGHGAYGLVTDEGVVVVAETHREDRLSLHLVAPHTPRPPRLRQDVGRFITMADAGHHLVLILLADASGERLVALETGRGTRHWQTRLPFEGGELVVVPERRLVLLRHPHAPPRFPYACMYDYDGSLLKRLPHDAASAMELAERAFAAGREHLATVLLHAVLEARPPVRVEQRAATLIARMRAWSREPGQGGLHRDLAATALVA